MGMFDTVYCEMRIPTSAMDRNFQTKDLDNSLYEYTIREDGTIFRGLGGATELVDDIDDKVITMYDYLDKSNTWIEYEVMIKNSRVIDIKLTKFEKIKKYRK